MKRILLIICLLLPLSALAGKPSGTVSASKVKSAISQCRDYEGVNWVNLGSFGTAAIKGVVRIAAIGNPDAREAVKLMKGIRRITIMEYEDCSGTDKTRITRKIEKALAGSDMLMEASGDGEKMRIYGVVNEKTDKVKDFVLYVPSSCALICIFGSISMDAIAKLSAHD